MNENVGKMVETLQAEGLHIVLEGDGNFVPSCIASLKQAGKDSLTFYIGDNPGRVAHLRDCVLICLPHIDPVPDSVIRIRTEHPKLAFIILAQGFAPPPPEARIHPTAIIHPEAVIHPTAAIGPYCVLEKCSVGERTALHSNVVVYSKSRIGAHTTVESNSCIGATGQGFDWGLDGKMWMMPQLGGVIIGDNCFIGALVTIVRGASQDTMIENGCRIAHGSMVGHNCQIGKDTFLANGIAMAGSTIVGKRCYLGSGSTYRNKVRLGNYITVGVGAAVIDDYLEDGLVLVGVPAKPLKSR